MGRSHSRCSSSKDVYCGICISVYKVFGSSSAQGTLLRSAKEPQSQLLPLSGSVATQHLVTYIAGFQCLEFVYSFDSEPFE